MKAITICQPYASLICLPESDPRHKRVENRRWYSHHVGLLAIHAGKSREWLDPGDMPGLDIYGFDISQLPFGAIVAVANQVACFPVEQIRAGEFDQKRFPWLSQHQHVEGPYCHILQSVRVLPMPLPCNGSQGYWTVPDSEIQAALR